MRHLLPLLITITSIPRIYSEVQPTKSNGNSNQILESRVLQLEQTVKDLQAKSQVQEQKYTVVLSSVLSKLTSTTDELKGVKTKLCTLKTDYKSLQTEFNELKVKQEAQEDEILRLRADLNVSETDVQSVMSSVGDLTLSLNSSKEEVKLLNTDITSIRINLTDIIDSLKVTSTTTDVRLNMVEEEVLSLSADQNSTKSEVEAIQSSLDSLSSIQGNLTSKLMEYLDENVVFEGSMYGANNLTVQKNTVWKVPNIMRPHAQGFNISTGYFTAPVSGSYMFWVNAIVVYPVQDRGVVIAIRDDSQIRGFAFGRSLCYGNGTYASVTGTTTTYLQKGTQIWFTPKMDVTFLRTMSRYGGALLQPSDGDLSFVRGPSHVCGNESNSIRDY